MRKKLINTNPLSTCALDHRPVDPVCRMKYRAIQIEILRKNADAEGYSSEDSIESLFDWLPEDIDFAGVDHLLEITARLAEIRIEDARQQQRS